LLAPEFQNIAAALAVNPRRFVRSMTDIAANRVLARGMRTTECERPEMFEMPSAAIDFGKAEIVASPKRMAAIIEIIAQQWQLPH
jgi:hypothetical protein